jgi:hypothetical protein
LKIGEGSHFVVVFLNKAQLLLLISNHILQCIILVQIRKNCQLESKNIHSQKHTKFCHH